MSKVSHNSDTSSNKDESNVGGLVNESLNTLITISQFHGTKFFVWSKLSKLYITGKGIPTYFIGDETVLSCKESMFAK